jgi:hypothetical protein
VCFCARNVLFVYYKMMSFFSRLTESVFKKLRRTFEVFAQSVGYVSAFIYY